MHAIKWLWTRNVSTASFHLKREPDVRMTEELFDASEKRRIDGSHNLKTHRTSRRSGSSHTLKLRQLAYYQTWRLKYGEVAGFGSEVRRLFKYLSASRLFCFLQSCNAVRRSSVQSQGDSCYYVRTTRDPQSPRRDFGHDVRKAQLQQSPAGMGRQILARVQRPVNPLHVRACRFILKEKTVVPSPHVLCSIGLNRFVSYRWKVRGNHAWQSTRGWQMVFAQCLQIEAVAVLEKHRQLLKGFT